MNEFGKQTSNDLIKGCKISNTFVIDVYCEWLGTEY